GRVVAGGGVAEQRENTVGRVLAAGGVVKERINPSSRVAEAGGVARERESTGGRVLAAGRVVIERTVADCHVAEAGGEAEKGVSAISGVCLRVASVRWRANRLGYGRKRKTAEQERSEKETALQRRPVD